MKKTFILLICTLVITCFTACGHDVPDRMETTVTEKNAVVEPASEKIPSQTEYDDSDKESLKSFTFSASAEMGQEDAVEGTISAAESEQTGPNYPVEQSNTKNGDVNENPVLNYPDDSQNLQADPEIQAGADLQSSDDYWFYNYDELENFRADCEPKDNPVTEYDKQWVLDIYNSNSHEERFNHPYDYSIKYDEICAKLVAANITVVMMDAYENEAGYMLELYVIREADEYYTLRDGRMVVFAPKESLCAHSYKDNKDLKVGEAYTGNIYMMYDGEYWEFVPQN